jgi:hypothetical protein
MMLIKDLLLESKANIINLGFPDIVAKLFFKNFGKHAYLMAQWFKQYHGPSDEKRWFEFHFSSFSDRPSTWDLVDLYNSTNSIETYLAKRKELRLYIDTNDVHDEEYLYEARKYLMDEIDERLFKKHSSMFRYYSLPRDILSGKITDINRYKNLPFWEAQHLYDQYVIFEKTEPLKQYKTGFKWINVGPHCSLLGSLMKNCGSAGVMSDDPNRTIIALFDGGNKPHVMVTYSPNQNRISGDEGAASSAVKVEYHRYVLDLANMLGAKLDDRTKSRLLFIKNLLKHRAKNVTQISKDLFDPQFRFEITGTVYYSNAQAAVTKDDVVKFVEMIKTGQVDMSQITSSKKKTFTMTELLKMIFSYRNTYIMKQLGIEPVSIHRLQ